MLSEGQQVGNYIVLEEIGVGGMAIVYKVQHTVLESVHAMKVLLPHLLRAEGVLDRFVEEAKIQAQFRHPSLVRVTDIVSEPGIAGLVMDYLEGSTLDRVIEQRPLIPVTEALRWTHQVCAALAYVHTRGVVHRDIKPGNLLLEEVVGQGSQVRVMDFGIAKVHLKDRTRTAVMMGTPAYMSPEQVTGSRIDARTDLFSLGAVLYELITGQAAFQGETDYQIQQAILSGDYIPVQELRQACSTHVATLIDKALRVEPAVRFSHARAMARQIAAAPEAEALVPI